MAVGLEGKMTATTATEELKEDIAKFLEEHGVVYRNTGLKAKGTIIKEGEEPKQIGSFKRIDAPKKQGTRLIKAQCECGCVIRIPRKWIDEAGLPTCGCGGKFQEDGE